MSEASLGTIVRLLADRGLAAEKAAARRIQRSEDPRAAVEAVVGALPEGTITLTAADVERALGGPPPSGAEPPPGRGLTVRRDMTGRSTGTGRYEDFLALFRDRYDRLRELLTDRVSPRSAAALAETSRRHGVGVIGMVTEIRSTSGGHWLLELEDRTGSCRALVHADDPLHERVRSIVPDEVVGVEGSLSDDGGLIFVDQLYQPDIPRSNRAATADRPVEAALVSDLHVGSEAFAAEAWSRFADWLAGPEAERVEYLVVGGDLVEGVGVYPGQSEELDIVDIYEQYEAFAERLKDVPGDLDIVLIPGNHDAVRLAEPQPGFHDELRAIVSVHDATVLSNPAVVELEGVSVLLYHGTSLDDILAAVPAEVADYTTPHLAMRELLKKRHLAPEFGSRTRIAPEERDHLV
ncbi:MAG: DNA-directed DNA polymerase II small subunit, partial [Halobacteriota archaeon]